MNQIAARFRILLWTGVCCSLGSVACGSGSSEYGDAPSASGGQVRWDLRAGPPAPETLLVLLDDTKAATDLRDALASAFDDLDDDLARQRASCSAPIDPAAWHPIDRSVVFARPSRPGPSGYWSAAQDPALRLRAQQAFGPERTRWMEAVRAGITAQPAPASAPFQALAALANAESLLDGSRPPETPAESDLLNALPSPLTFGTVIALATEDASSGESSQYPYEFQSDLLSVVLPAEQPREISDCSDRSPPTTARYQAFSDRAQAWPCKNPDFFGTSSSSDCNQRCLRQPVAIDSGIAQCRATARYPGSEPCPTELGWLDPLDGRGQRTARVEGSGTNATRVCEIRQLEGPALTSCVTRLDCTNCEPGWCATQVPELVPQSACAAGSYYPPFRFVLGAGQARSAEVSVVCNQAAF